MKVREVREVREVRPFFEKIFFITKFYIQYRILPYPSLPQHKQLTTNKEHNLINLLNLLNNLQLFV